MNKMGRILLLGSGETGIFALNHLLQEGFDVFVFTGNEDSGIDTWKPSLLKEAKRLGVPSDNPIKPYIPPNFTPDHALSIQYPKIIKESFLDIIKIPIINFHTAPLPELRGVDTCAWAILDGLKYFGVTVHVIDKGVDTGPIIDKEVYPIRPEDTTWSLFEKNNHLMKKMISERLPYYLSGKYTIVKNDGINSYFHKKGEIDFSQLEVDTSLPIAEQDRFIRSRIFPKLQLPFITISGQKQEIVSCLLNNGKLALTYKD